MAHDDDDQDLPRPGKPALPASAVFALAVVVLAVVGFFGAWVVNPADEGAAGDEPGQGAPAAPGSPPPAAEGAGPQERAGASGTAQPSPFADLPPDDGGRARRTRRPPPTDAVPAALAGHEDWSRARVLGAEAASALAGAGASASGREAARAAADGFDQALRLTDGWAERLRRELGSDERGVRALDAYRAGWREGFAEARALLGR